MSKYSQFDALLIIEALRSGIPSRSVAEVFQQGREKILKEVEDHLYAVSETRNASSYLFQAEFGNGKTHLLNMIFDMAWGRNFVVSKVVLSKETPLNKPESLYRKAAQNCYLPGNDLPGFDRQVMKMNIRDDKVEDLLVYCDSNMHPRLKAVFECCLYAEGDLWNLSFGDLLGDFLPKGVLSSIYFLSMQKKAKIPGFKKSCLEDILQYFKFLTLLFETMGYAGWVILFDEAELLMRHGPTSRIKAYKTLRSLMNMDGNLDFPLFTVFAYATTFEQFLVEKEELHKLPAKIKNDPDEAENVRTIVERLLNIRSLPGLTQKDYMDIAEKIKDLHATAFNWEANVDLKNIMEEILHYGTVERRVRTLIRGLIQKLDLMYLERPTEIEMEELEETPLDEDEDFFLQENNDDSFIELMETTFRH